MMLTAHSGCDDTPMNSVEYITHAGSLAVDAAEIDVRRGSDGTLILTHNEALPEDKMVTLRTCLELLKDTGKMINADLKEPFLETDVLKTAEEVGFAAERIIFTGCVGDPASMKDKVAPAQVFFNPEEIDPAYYKKLPELTQEEAADYNRQILEKISAFGYPAVNVNYRVMTPAFADCCRKLNLGISAWTVDDPQAQQKLKALGVLNITSRRPGTV